MAAFGFDIVAVVVTWLVAYALRFNGSVPDDFWHGGINALVWVVVIYAVMFRIFGLYLPVCRTSCGSRRLLRAGRWS
jgi:FlaA1/EpsC-like NDP-sugar epimerase